MRPLILVDIGGESLPVVTPVNRPALNWVPPKVPAVVVAPPSGVQVVPAVDTITITWERSPLIGAIYVVWRAPDVNGGPGSWSMVTRTSDTRYTYTDPMCATSWWKVTVMVNGVASLDSGPMATVPVQPLLQGDLTEVIEQVDQYSEAVIKQAIDISKVNDAAVANRAYIAELQTTKVSAEGAAAIVKEQVGAATADMTATVQDISKAVTELNGDLEASRTLKVQTTKSGKSYVAGIAIGVKASGGLTQSEIAMLANHFVFMTSVDDDTYYYPLEIVDGKVYINAAMIRDATINFAKISEELKTSNYQWDGSQGIYKGWRLAKNGQAQFGGDVEVRGTVYADKLIGEVQKKTVVNWEGNTAASSGASLVTFELASPILENGSHTPMIQLTLEFNNTAGDPARGNYVVERLYNGGWIKLRERAVYLGTGASGNASITIVDDDASDARTYRLRVADGGLRSGSFMFTNVNGIVFGVR
ncbi:DUF1983 domain-containing protein [uncultured Xanthomonas sp.]|uniref:phage tail tip fiber protein n=1 Tax=uncultured Xanthomonas sp. TaxID=152831 RepID=UPI0025DAE0B5|nr:DUF1983 domain-containing protein [uncultured Xanthomonas sp.]